MLMYTQYIRYNVFKEVWHSPILMMSGKAVVTLACLARMQKATIAMNTLFFLMAPAASIF